ncbi:uroporphyrinogen decarboxylase [Leuconostoc litchii]|uniref:Uroporphyrinogen decarboxylase n=1 Tax=Leuconostoc litchii TaxID=1981069 RepID=A0A6P2CLG2_9LACO|nr:uroporphyrinogen decarboxylase family protein [Leuconostoc litchii]TYC46108.1 uroporphyrinogen decarboxylase [Leuconostoc litchii]GMA69805.1 uroporphyrinogen decarboxylase [Leuconostoc litchii]
MSKQQNVLLNPTEKIPVSFWRHFADDETVDALVNPRIASINIQGHQKYVEEVAPDFVKLMSDGYFNVPFKHVEDPKNFEQLRTIQTISDDDKWLTEQVKLVQEQKNVIGSRKGFYNIFSPITLLKWALYDAEKEEPVKGDEQLADWFIKYPEEIKHILGILANSVIKQIKAVVSEGGADGVYYSTQELQSPKYTKALFDDIQKEVDLTVIKAIQSVSDISILHICGFSGTSNHLEWFKDYDLPIVNWAVNVEGVSLQQGQQIFKDKVVLGGFGNTIEDVLYQGTKEDIETAVHELLADVDKSRVIVGADCTVPRDISIDHLKWAVAAVHATAI